METPTNQVNDVGAHFSGLSVATAGANALLTGDEGGAQGFFWWAIGETVLFGGGIPAFNGSDTGGATSTSRVRLFIR